MDRLHSGSAVSAVALIAADDVSMVFDGRVRALDHVSLSAHPGDILGVVGESGSGKTTLLRLLMGLALPTSGSVSVDGEPLRDVLARDALAFRRRAQMLLQDAAASLSPRMSVRALLAEPLRIHALPFAPGWTRVLQLLEQLGLSESVLDKYPHQISGGQARRVAIARALSLAPALIVADEPTAGLDVSVQGELLNLLLDLQRDLRLTYIVVSHNLNVVRRITTRTAVMYLGQILEEAPTSRLFTGPAHPYSAALLSTNPAINPRKRKPVIVLRGEVPSAVAPPSGCRFHPRCFQAEARCSVEAPQLRPVAVQHTVRCHFPLTGPATG